MHSIHTYMHTLRCLYKIKICTYACTHSKSACSISTSAPTCLSKYTYIHTSTRVDELPDVEYLLYVCCIIYVVCVKHACACCSALIIRTEFFVTKLFHPDSLLYIYIYIYTHLHVHMHTCICIHAYTYTFCVRRRREGGGTYSR